jgi:hypothetical protein
MRSETNSPAWQAIPIRAGARRPRMLNFGQFIRSLVFAALGFALAAVISLQPARGGAGANAPHLGAAAGPVPGCSILHFPR